LGRHVALKSVEQNMAESQDYSYTDGRCHPGLGDCGQKDSIFRRLIQKQTVASLALVPNLVVI